MALVDKKRKFIFIHIFKCGGNAIRKVLKDDSTCEEIGSGHANARDVKELMGKEYDDYYKFAIVRNPFDWLLSTYYYIVYSGYTRHKEKVEQLESFNEFPQHYVDYMMKEQMPLGANKCTLLKDYVTDVDGNLIVDYIGKMETLQKDMNYVLQSIGIDHTMIPKVNVNVNKLGKQYKDCYSEEAKNYVLKNFAADLKMFDYEY